MYLVFFIGERIVYGWTVLAELKADPELAKIPVFVISMVSDEKRWLPRDLKAPPKAYQSRSNKYT